MKKILKISILMIIFTITITGCKKDDDLIASIKLVSGWEKFVFEGEPYKHTNAYYDKDAHGTGAFIILMKDVITEPCTAEEYVNIFQSAQKRYLELSDFEFSTIFNTKVGGRNAVEFTYTYTCTAIHTDFSITKYKARVIIISTSPKDKYIIWGYSFESDYDTVAADFQSMIDSYRLK